ncbi:hypothetical protein GcVgp1 [Goose circovirus]|uniref:Uncharacterized protein ORFV2 n=1 Tax=Goose circovirus TaxID=146032 RepID=ORFV2_GOCV|nr:hypothetical protein GcVgp1 [Goose circovirus]Q91EK4.1 RecName: Full=Uncharacterized protein ORFV2 [Goose circovirus]CAC50260.1 hypothetical protein [Goose circovirus]
MFCVCLTLKIVYFDLIRPMCSLRRLYRRLRLVARLRREYRLRGLARYSGMMGSGFLWAGTKPLQAPYILLPAPVLRTPHPTRKLQTPLNEPPRTWRKTATTHTRGGSSLLITLPLKITVP